MYVRVVAPTCHSPFSYIPEIAALTLCHVLKLFFFLRKCRICDIRETYS